MAKEGNGQRRAAESGPRPILTPFDATSLVVGAVVGAGIYVVASLATELMGPAMLVAWVLAAAMASLIALAFAQCATIVPRSGGPFVYTREAFGYFPGFMAGWALYLSGLVSISVMPICFVSYLTFFVPDLNWWQGMSVRAILIAFVTATNYFGTRTAGRVNDVLVAAKLGPLLLLILLGLVFVGLNPRVAVSNVIPFAPLTWEGLGETVILVFWAFAGFEFAVLPAAEIIDAPRTLPMAIIRGIGIIAGFYLLLNAVVLLVMPWSSLAGTAAPLAEAMQTTMLALSLPWWAIGGAIMALGALLSISGADESITLGISRLNYAMAADGYFPHYLAYLHPKYGTPYRPLIFQGAFALIVSSIGSLTELIELTVLLRSLTYLATAMAAIRLARRIPERELRFTGSRMALALAFASGVYLISQVETWVLLVGILLISIGVLVYAVFAPRSELREVQEHISSEEHRLAAIERGLFTSGAHALQRARSLFRK